MEVDGYREGCLVWLENDAHVWEQGALLESLNNNLGVLRVQKEDGTVVQLQIQDLSGLPFLKNPDILLGQNDLTCLSYLHEPAVLHNLKYRYLDLSSIYTYCGIVLVAINPYTNVSIYGERAIEFYRGENVRVMEPHIYAIAEEAFTYLASQSKNQSVIVSGESGAGKTVSAKYVIQYLVHVSSSQADIRDNDFPVENRILASNPVMEGKMERNYHIFYQLVNCNPANPDLAELKEFLGPPTHFHYLKECPKIDGVDDSKDFAKTCEALLALGIGVAEQKNLFHILLAILHLGNIEFQGQRSDDCCTISDGSHESVVNSCKLLGIETKDATKWLRNRQVVAGRDVVQTALRIDQARSSRDAVCKRLYMNLFSWVVARINQITSCASQKQFKFIAVLDIYGFETFEQNSFEQLCINYANEKLQLQFNEHVFKLEQEEYQREDITWTFINFQDNQPCIDLFEKKMGLIDLMEEQCRILTGSDESWLQKVGKSCSGNQFFKKPNTGRLTFKIVHFADTVTYDATGFYDKNVDLVNKGFWGLLMDSKVDFVQKISMDAEFVESQAQTGTGKTIRKKCVAVQFQSSLKKLMTDLNSTTPHYVRCIKPNDEKVPFSLNPQRAVQQLRACGILETVRVSAAGYPSRYPYVEFVERYRALVPNARISADKLPDTARLICQNNLENSEKFECGKTKIFFRTGQIACLEMKLDSKLKSSATLIQKIIRGWLARVKYQQKREALRLIQAACRAFLCYRRLQYIQMQEAILRIQSFTRMAIQRRRYLRTRKAFISLQAACRGYLIRKNWREMIFMQKAIILQSYARTWLARTRFLKARKQVITVQCCVRRFLAKKQLKRLRIEARSLDNVKLLNKGYENKIIELQQRVMAQKHVTTSHRQEIEEKEARIKVLSYENESWKSKVEVLKKEMEQLASEKLELELRAEEMETYLDDEHRRTEVLTVELERCQQHYNAWMENGHEVLAVQQQEKLMSRINQMERENESLKEHIARTERLCLSDSISSATMELRKQLEKAEGEVMKLQKQLRSLLLKDHIDPRDYDQHMAKLQNDLNDQRSTNENLRAFIATLCDRGSPKRLKGSAPGSTAPQDPESIEELFKSNAHQQRLINLQNTQLSEKESRIKDLCDEIDRLVKDNSRQQEILAKNLLENSPDSVKITENLQRVNQNLLDENLSLRNSLDRHAKRYERLKKRFLKQNFTVISDPMTPTSSNSEPSEGILFCKPEHIPQLMKNVIIDMTPQLASTFSPRCLPSYILLMCERFFDFEQSEEGLIAFHDRLHGALVELLRKASTLENSIMVLSLSHRFLQLLRQYSGIEIYNRENTELQRDHVFQNFDMSLIDQVEGFVSSTVYERVINQIRRMTERLAIHALLERDGMNERRGRENSPLSNNGTLSRRRFSLFAARTEVDQLTNLTDQLSHINKLLEMHGVDMPLVQMIFCQLLHDLSVVASNQVLMRRDYCNWEKGMHVKYNLNSLEDWCRRNIAGVQIDVVLAHLEPLRQVVNLLFVKKNVPSRQTVQSIIDTCSQLHISQVVKLLSNFSGSTADERIPTAVIKEVKKELLNLRWGSVESEESDSDQVLFSQTIIQPDFPYVASKVRLNEVVIPDSLKLNFLMCRVALSNTNILPAAHQASFTLLTMLLFDPYYIPVDPYYQYEDTTK